MCFVCLVQCMSFVSIYLYVKCCEIDLLFLAAVHLFYIKTFYETPLCYIPQLLYSKGYCCTEYLFIRWGLSSRLVGTLALLM